MYKRKQVKPKMMFLVFFYDVLLFAFSVPVTSDLIWNCSVALAEWPEEPPGLQK